MNAYDYDAVIYYGEVYCLECLGPRQRAKAAPIFADTEHEEYPVCTVCGTEHRYVTLFAPCEVCGRSRRAHGNDAFGPACEWQHVSQSEEWRA